MLSHYRRSNAMSALAGRDCEWRVGLDQNAGGGARMISLPVEMQAGYRALLGFLLLCDSPSLRASRKH